MIKRAGMAKLHDRSIRGGQARVASDQITDAGFFSDLIPSSLTIEINIGSQVPRDGGLNALPNAVQVQALNGGKAHAKFISGGGGVFLGSPNYTRSALNGGTVESGVTIRNPRIQAYFNRYFDLMRGGAMDNAQFTKLVRAFNSSGQPVSLALAPYLKIQPWLFAELATPTRLIIRMFLISDWSKGIGIVEGLNALARKNPNMSMKVYVDEGQYDNGSFTYFDKSTKKKTQKYYVRTACGLLMQGAPNVQVFTQTGANGIMHDKLILAETDSVSGTGQITTAKRVFLGSSGFSTNVMNNSNWEIMVRVDEDKLYDYMMSHHNATLNSTAYNTKQLPPPTDKN